MLPDTPDADVRIHPKALFLRPYGTRDIRYQLDETAAEDAAWAAAKDVYFVDGGVLDNAPFDLVIDAIARRQAQTQVNRQLVYVEPDPGQALYAPIGDKPRQSQVKSAVAQGPARRERCPKQPSDPDRPDPAAGSELAHRRSSRNLRTTRATRRTEMRDRVGGSVEGDAEQRYCP